MIRSILNQVRPAHVLTVIGIAVAGVSLWLSNRLVQELVDAERRRLALYVEVLKYNATADNGETEFLFNNVIRQSNALINVPTIITDTTGLIVADNLDIGGDPAMRQQLVEKELAEMKANTDQRPLVIEYATGQYQYLYFRENRTIRLLRYFPYVTLLIVTMILAGAVYNFTVSLRDQQNRVWAGLAKETAHQLGTPISGLMAWIELLRMRMEDQAATAQDTEILREMEADVQHLQNIAERFSKIGSEPELTVQPLQPILERAVQYVKGRLTRSANFTVLLTNELAPGFQVALNAILFEWVVENLMKNALDAMAGQKQGAIVLRAKLKGRLVEIDVEDTGKGIQKQHLKDVFKPGFTTKKRGWGLGLSLSRRIIQNYHKGKIFVRRSEPGRGTTFRILLPVTDQTQRTVTQENTTPAQVV